MNPGTEAIGDLLTQVEELAQEVMRKLDLLSGSKVQDDVSYGQYKALSIIHGHGPVPVGFLGRSMGSAQSTTSEMVARLTKAGLVTKVRGPYDGRVVMVDLTDQGRQLMRRRRKRIREIYQSLFAKLGPADQEAFASALRKLNEILAKTMESSN